MKNIQVTITSKEEIVERPGYQGSRRDADYKRWNTTYGKENWRLSWIDSKGTEYTIEDIVFKVYAEGYAEYFHKHHHELDDVLTNYGYAYDLDMIPKEKAWDLYYLYQKPGVENQFHHVAFNYAITNILNKEYKGTKPLHVRPGEPEQPEVQWPEGWKWHPGRILLTPYYLSRIPETILSDKNNEKANEWYSKNSIEHFYQASKALLVSNYI